MNPQSSNLTLLTNHNVGGFPPKLLRYPLEAGVLSYLGRGVDVLHREQGPQSEQQDFGESCYQLEIERSVVVIVIVTVSARFSPGSV